MPLLYHTSHLETDRNNNNEIKALLKAVGIMTSGLGTLKNPVGKKSTSRSKANSTKGKSKTMLAGLVSCSLAVWSEKKKGGGDQ